MLYKGTHELHGQVEGVPHKEGEAVKSVSFAGAIMQIGLLDIIFSLDSVITAVGMARHLAIMIAAVILAIVIMIIFAGRVSHFIEQHPAMRVLALAFLLLIGVMLVAEGVGPAHRPGIYLLCHGVFAGGGAHKYAEKEQTETACSGRIALPTDPGAC